MKSMAVLAVSILSLSSAGAWAAADGVKAPIFGDAARGRLIADKWCASCHGAGVGSATDQVPSFVSIARNIGAKPEALRTFLRAPHQPMPPLQLSNQEIEDLAVFIESRR
jgi:mono/diheme cytochrome c family protein